MCGLENIEDINVLSGFQGIISNIFTLANKCRKVIYKTIFLPGNTLVQGYLRTLLRQIT